MKVNIVKAGMQLNLDKRTLEMLRLINDNEEVEVSQLIRTMYIMGYTDWDRFDKQIDLIIIESSRPVSSDNMIRIMGSSSLKKDINVVSEDKIKIRRRTNKTPKEIKNEILDLYNSDNNITIKELAEKIGAGHTTISRYLKILGINRNNTGGRPNYSKDLVFKYISENPNTTLKEISDAIGISKSTASKYKNMYLDENEVSNRKTSVLKYIQLSDDEKDRKKWLDRFIRKNHVSMRRVYKKLTNIYGIVFQQKGQDILYDHKLTPIEDYPLPTKYEIVILDEGLFDLSKAILINDYDS